MVVSMIQNTCMADCFYICERTTLSHTDNTTGLWWQRKFLATSLSPPDELLRLQVIHLRSHCYVLRHNFLSGLDNGISDRPSLSQELTYTALLAHMDASRPQDLPWRISTLPSNIFSAIYSELRRTTSPRESLLVNPLPPMGTGRSGPTYVDKGPSTPYSPCTGIRTLSSTCSQGSIEQDPSPLADTK